MQYDDDTYVHVIDKQQFVGRSASPSLRRRNVLLTFSTTDFWQGNSPELVAYTAGTVCDVSRKVCATSSTKHRTSRTVFPSTWSRVKRARLTRFQTHVERRSGLLYKNIDRHFTFLVCYSYRVSTNSGRWDRNEINWKIIILSNISVHKLHTAVLHRYS